MKYTEKTEIDGVKKALKVFLAQQGTTLKELCGKHGLNYNSVYQKVNRGHVDEEEINKIAALIDPCFTLRKINNTYIINRGLTR
jgi:lambda repressor-like predicted transcriptional regulator